jgi:hypothetical protein
MTPPISPEIKLLFLLRGLRMNRAPVCKRLQVAEQAASRTSGLWGGVRKILQLPMYLSGFRVNRLQSRNLGKLQNQRSQARASYRKVR